MSLLFNNSGMTALIENASFKYMEGTADRENTAHKPSTTHRLSWLHVTLHHAHEPWWWESKQQPAGPLCDEVMLQQVFVCPLEEEEEEEEALLHFISRHCLVHANNRNCA